MKRSRIFLGITTALLALGGVAAAKAHRSPAKDAYFSIVSGAVVTCTGVKVTRCTLTAGGTAICITLRHSKVYGLYTAPNASGPCVVSHFAHFSAQ